MKRCSRCHEIKEKKYFPKNHRNKDGLDYWCKECKRESIYKRLGKVYIRKSTPKPMTGFDALGGYNITILNHTKRGEYKYSIISTKGGVFYTNDRDKFLLKLQEVL